jgi:hypothetical protein
VFGERRLVACRDRLGWAEIDVRIVPVSSIAAGEYAENELRKEFTPSERVAILETIERMKAGNPNFSNRPARVDSKTAAKSVGFRSKTTANDARRVVRDGVPELVAAMDKGAIAIRPASEIARLPQAEQRAAVAAARRKEAAEHRESIAARTESRRHERKARKITIPWSAVPAARILAERWPPSLCRDLIAALDRRLAAAQEAA